MNARTKIEEMLQGHISSYALHNPPGDGVIDRLLKLVNEARIDENQRKLDKIIEYENYVPAPGELTTRSFGSASGAMEVAGFKRGFEQRIKQLQDSEAVE